MVTTEAAQWGDHMSAPSTATVNHYRSTLLLLVVLLAGCRTNRPDLKTFATPEEAGNALVSAARSYDATRLTTIFGPDSKEVISSGDTIQDKNTAATFARGYDAMHRWRKMADGSEVLLVGYDNFPFPIPLKKNGDGRWFFDTAAGKEEVLNRRIGRNELAVIAVCDEVAKAQAQYFSQPHDGAKAKQYAQKFISDPGKHNGLYWTPQPNEPKSPLGPLAAFATAEGYTIRPDAHVPFHGYFFRMLQGQTSQAPGGAKTYVKDGKMTQGFALIAYPAEYGVSGIMTFMLNQDGVLLQKDLGTQTTSIGANMTEFNPDPEWKIVVQQQT